MAVLGAGVSGRSAARLLEAEGYSVRVFDEKAGDVFDPGAGDFARVVVSPGFAPAHEWRHRAAAAGLPVMGETALSASRWPGELLCVTGTNGKTTLVRFLQAALEGAGESARACGNIGLPLADLCLDDPRAGTWAICETSSFQLYDWPSVSCRAGFWTNFGCDHLDWHPSIKAYFAAKWRLLESGARVFAGPSVEAWAAKCGRSLPPNLSIVPEERCSGGEQGIFRMSPWNELFALAAAWWAEEGLPWMALTDAARSFRLSPHRLEDVGEVRGVRFVNDSKATNPHAVAAALRSVPGPVHWIGGGSFKGEDMDAFARILAERIATADTFGLTGKELAGRLSGLGVDTSWHEGLVRAFSSAVRRADRSGTVLLSPGFASFDQFSGYAERGDLFRRLATELRETFLRSCQDGGGGE